MKKNNHPNTKPETKPKYKFDFYRSMLTWQDAPVNDAFKSRLAAELFTWARDNNDALKLSQFYLERGINTEAFNRWVNDNNDLRMARDAAMMLIGNRREIGCIKKKYDSALIARSMPRYDIEWKDLTEWWLTAKAQAESQGKNTPKFVVVENLEDIARANEPKKETPKKIKSKKKGKA